MRKLLPLFLFSVMLAPAVLAEPVAGEGDVPALIKQLGDDDPKLREEASEKLHRMGKQALEHGRQQLLFRLKRLMDQILPRPAPHLHPQRQRV